MTGSLRLPLLLLFSALLSAQERSDLHQILERLTKIEQQNQELAAEVRALRQELAGRSPTATAAPPAVVSDPPTGAPETATASAPLNERVEVQERRVEELAQSKVESDHRLPIQLTGMLLFNTYWNGRRAGDTNNPTTASETVGPPIFGGTFRQSVLGLKFQGPSIAGGGKVSGALFMDFYAGTGAALNQLMRVRVASLDLAWKNTTLSFAHDKPIIAPREPNSLAQVGVSPLTGAGNLWYWQPQIRLEQRFSFGETAGLRAQAAVIQTNESTNNVPADYLPLLARGRPGLEGRLEFWKDFGARRIEIAPGFHISDSKVAQYSLPARIYSLDWLVRPFSMIDFTGSVYTGENANVLGGLRPGITYFPDGIPRSVSGSGGWGQVTLRTSQRLSFNVYGGWHGHRYGDLLPGSISRNITYAGNVMYRLGPNVIASMEASQVRTSYLGSGIRLVPHYDLAIAYLY